MQYWEDKSRPVPLFLVGTKKDLITNEDTIQKLKENNETIVTMEEVGMGAVVNARRRKWLRS